MTDTPTRIGPALPLKINWRRRSRAAVATLGPVLMDVSRQIIAILRSDTIVLLVWGALSRRR